MLHTPKDFKRATTHVRLLCLIFFMCVCLLSCTSAEGVATFADTADKALEEGPQIFRDIHDSCVRRHAVAEPIRPIFLTGVARNENNTHESNRLPADPSVCARFAPQGEALAQASGVLSAYFRALQQLAAFNTSTVSSPSEQAAQNAATAANLTANQIADIGKLAGLITRIFTAHYQHRHLIQDLREADPSISSVTQAFETIVSKDYQGLLQEEQRAVTRRYQDNGNAQTTALVLLLNRAYSDDVADLNRRKTAAEAYVTALQQIREGHHTLAKNAGHLSAKDLSIALQPYTAELQSLVPALQKSF